MTLEKIPYFMTNENWYYDDIEKGIIVLKDDAPPEAVESYKEFYKTLNDSLKI